MSIARSGRASTSENVRPSNVASPSSVPTQSNPLVVCDSANLRIGQTIRYFPKLVGIALALFTTNSGKGEEQAGHESGFNRNEGHGLVIFCAMGRYNHLRRKDPRFFLGGGSTPWLRTGNRLAELGKERER